MSGLMEQDQIVRLLVKQGWSQAKAQAAAALEMAKRPKDRILSMALGAAVTEKAPKAKRPPRGMNKTEARRDAELAALLRSSTGLLAYGYETITLKLAPDCRYTPDFWLLSEGSAGSATLAFEEIKGFWRDDAKVKLRLAARLFPFWTFTALQWRNGTWHREVFHPLPGSPVSDAGGSP